MLRLPTSGFATRLVHVPSLSQSRDYEREIATYITLHSLSALTPHGHTLVDWPIGLISLGVYALRFPFYVYKA